MKFLEVDSLDVLNTVFRWETVEAILTGRIEAYSCKSAGSDKKLFKQIESKYNVDLSGGSISPDDYLHTIVSPFGRLDESTPRKTFFYLLATLNAAFPEHDFGDVRPDQFSKQPSPDMVINSVNTTLFNLGNDEIVNKYRMWDTLDEIVDLGECDVYSYNPDIEDDPMNDEEGYLWSINYFFFNRKLKRMVFFSIKSESMNAPPEDDDEDDDGEEYGVFISNNRNDNMLLSPF